MVRDRKAFEPFKKIRKRLSASPNQSTHFYPCSDCGYLTGSIFNLRHWEFELFPKSVSSGVANKSELYRGQSKWTACTPNRYASRPLSSYCSCRFGWCPTLTCRWTSFCALLRFCYNQSQWVSTFHEIVSFDAVKWLSMFCCIVVSPAFHRDPGWLVNIGSWS